MKQAYLIRNPSNKYGTHGALMVPEIGWSCFTAEPPDKGNRPRVSCIPEDQYIVKMRKSPKYGWIFHLTDVNGRTYILIHSGNYSGDIELGLRSNTMGCILLGQKRGWLSKQLCVLNSRTTLRRFMEQMGSDEFMLTIMAA